MLVTVFMGKQFAYQSEKASSDQSFITGPSCTQGLQLAPFQFCQRQSIFQREGWICVCVAQTDHISGNCKETALL